MIHWWTGLPPAEAAVTCAERRHILRWDAGRLTTMDHGDPEQEATLAALAGETYPCLELLRAWSRRRDDPRVLTLASRGPGDLLTIDLDPRRHRPGPARVGAEGQILRLLATGGGLPDRLQATTAAIWTRRLQTGHAALEAARPQLVAALYGRALRTLRAWLGEPQLAIELTMTDPDAERRLIRTPDGLRVSLPFSWLSEVWAHGLAVTFGRFCLAAEAQDGPRFTLRALAPDLTDVITIATTSRR